MRMKEMKTQIDELKQIKEYDSVVQKSPLKTEQEEDLDVTIRIED